MSQDKEDSLSRRRFLIAAGGGMAGLLAAGSLLPSRAASSGRRGGRFAENPFTLGVASGDPAPDGMVLWTRLAPHPLDGDGGGMPPVPVAVEWRIAADERFGSVLRSGTVDALPALAHSVHVELTGLEPDRWYWYQFIAGDVESPIGRTRTAPAAGATLPRLSLAFASCQNWQAGLFTAYQHLGKEDLDLVVFLGDYIYEGGIGANLPRKHNSPEIVTLTDYRNRYALYKSDPLLQAAHAAFPWIVTWDDHEVENNYASLIRENNRPPGDFRQRRAAAYQAYYEHQPLRRAALPNGPDMQLYRRIPYGSVATFHVLDTRQYRTDQPAANGTRAGSPTRLDKEATLPGMAQEKWLMDGLDRSSARWNILAQQVFMAQRDYTPGPGERFSMDAWDGYAASRGRLFDFLGQRRPSNPIVLTGDVHANWVAELKADFREQTSRTLGVEFVGTSISSGGNGTDTTPGAKTVLTENPHIKFHNSQRGYVRCVVTPDNWRSDYRVISFVDKPGGEITTRASFVVENGKPGVLPG